MNIPQWNGNFLKEFTDQHIADQRRKKKITKGSKIATDKKLMKTAARLKIMSIAITKSLALNLSAKVPA